MLTNSGPTNKPRQAKLACRGFFQFCFKDFQFFCPEPVTQLGCRRIWGQNGNNNQPTNQPNQAVPTRNPFIWSTLL